MKDRSRRAETDLGEEGDASGIGVVRRDGGGGAKGPPGRRASVSGGVMDLRRPPRMCTSGRKAGPQQTATRMTQRRDARRPGRRGPEETRRQTRRGGPHGRTGTLSRSETRPLRV